MIRRRALDEITCLAELVLPDAEARRHAATVDCNDCPALAPCLEWTALEEQRAHEEHWRAPIRVSRAFLLGEAFRRLPASWRCVWLALLALAARDGTVGVSQRSLARLTGVGRQAVRASIEALQVCRLLTRVDGRPGVYLVATGG